VIVLNFEAPCKKHSCAAAAGAQYSRAPDSGVVTLQVCLKGVGTHLCNRAGRDFRSPVR